MYGLCMSVLCCLWLAKLFVIQIEMELHIYVRTCNVCTTYYIIISCPSVYSLSANQIVENIENNYISMFGGYPRQRAHVSFACIL